MWCEPGGGFCVKVQGFRVVEMKVQLVAAAPGVGGPDVRAWQEVPEGDLIPYKTGVKEKIEAVTGAKKIQNTSAYFQYLLPGARKQDRTKITLSQKGPDAVPDLLEFLKTHLPQPIASRGDSSKTHHDEYQLFHVVGRWEVGEREEHGGAGEDGGREQGVKLDFQQKHPFSYKKLIFVVVFARHLPRARRGVHLPY